MPSQTNKINHIKVKTKELSHYTALYSITLQNFYRITKKENKQKMQLTF